MFMTALAISVLGAQFKDVSAPPRSLLKSVYYVPFRFETYTPITRLNIEAQGVNVATKLRTKEEMLLRALKHQGKASKIDTRRIRLKVTTAKGEVIYLDATFVAMIGAKQFRLHEKSRAVVDALFYEDWMIESN
jgi:hypothetical protein